MRLATRISDSPWYAELCVPVVSHAAIRRWPLARKLVVGFKGAISNHAPERNRALSKSNTDQEGALQFSASRPILR
jgi:hypothetical protein